jgi:hypothetical protein
VDASLASLPGDRDFRHFDSYGEGIRLGKALVKALSVRLQRSGVMPISSKHFHIFRRKEAEEAVRRSGLL